jgi:hypothetical protein
MASGARAAPDGRFARKDVTRTRAVPEEGPRLLQATRRL